MHIWYLRGTRSWLAYLLMGTEVREELKAKQLEKVIYFAANLVTWVDEEKRHTDLPNIEAEIIGERDEIEKERDKKIDQRFKELENELADLEKQGAKESELNSRRRASEKDVAAIREEYEMELDSSRVRSTSSRTSSLARSSRTSCSGASWSTVTATTSKAAWAPTPSRV